MNGSSLENKVHMVSSMNFEYPYMRATLYKVEGII